jgi:hypothetical protein
VLVKCLFDKYFSEEGAEPEKVLMYENNLADRHLVKRSFVERLGFCLMGKC